MNPKKPNTPPRPDFTLMLESRQIRPILDERIVRHALAGPVTILDTGNCFNPLRLSRRIRWQTVQVPAVLGRIQVARAFTCFQVISLLEKIRQPVEPVYILRLLATFMDEIIPTHERTRLLAQVSTHIQRLNRTAALTVTIRSPLPQEEQLLRWIGNLQARADHIIVPQEPTPPSPIRLF
jgi:hypothetical protein